MLVMDEDTSEEKKKKVETSMGQETENHVLILILAPSYL